MNTDNAFRLSSLPILRPLGHAAAAKGRKAGLRQRGDKAPKEDIIVYNTSSPVVSISITDSFPSCEQLAKKSRDMSNYDVGWSEEFSNVVQSIEKEGCDDANGSDHAESCVGSNANSSSSTAARIRKAKSRMKVALPDTESPTEPVVMRSSSSKRAFKWTPEQDDLLKAAVAKVSAESKRLGKWERVAEEMQIQTQIPSLQGFVFTGEMCRVRWSHYVGPMQQGLTRGGVWTNEEIEKLRMLVQQHTTAATEKRPAEIHWNIICNAEHLNRIPQECRNKWYELCDQHRNQGPFTKEENSLILRLVASWTHPKRKTGLWVSLGRDLDRPSKKIRDHWRCNLVPKDGNINVGNSAILSAENSESSEEKDATTTSE